LREDEKSGGRAGLKPGAYTGKKGAAVLRPYRGKSEEKARCFGCCPESAISCPTEEESKARLDESALFDGAKMV